MHDVWFGCPLMTLVLLVTRVTWVTRMGWAPLWVDLHRSLWRMKVSWDIEQATGREREWLTVLFLVSFCSLLQLGIYKLLLTCFRYIYIYIYCLNKFPGLFFWNYLWKQSFFWRRWSFGKKSENSSPTSGIFHIGPFFCQAKSLERRGPAKGGGKHRHIIFKYPRNFRVWSMM